MFANRRWLKAVMQLSVLSLVAWGVWSTLRKSADQLDQQRQRLEQTAAKYQAQAERTDNDRDKQRLQSLADQTRQSVQDFWKADPGGLLLAGIFYGLGMLPGALYWRRCLAALHQPTHLLTTLWAYFYGNLGKYFPGKAMVIVLRIGALSPLGIKRIAVSITIFMETLTMMAVGGAVASVCLALLNIDWRLTLLSVGLLTTTFLPTYPPLLRWLIPKLQRGVETEVLDQWTRQIHFGLLASGWLQFLLTWSLYGLSLMCVLRSLDVTELAIDDPWRFAVSCLGASALAVVLGFVSLIPGGAGVREAVLSIVLTPVVGPIAALCGAIWLRIVWLATELIFVGVLLICKKLQVATCISYLGLRS